MRSTLARFWEATIAPQRDARRYLPARPLLWVGVAIVALIASAIVAVQRPVPQWELDLTERINDVPQSWADVLYPVMQLGTFAAPLLAAAVILLLRRDLWLTGGVIVAGLVAWFGAKGVKRIVERGRPRAYIEDINIREGQGLGLGFISGHSAVAAATAVVVMAALPRRWRFVPVVLAALVGFARVVFGVHLVADVIGGWSVGVLIGIATLWVLELLRSSQPSEVAAA